MRFGGPRALGVLGLMLIAAMPAGAQSLRVHPGATAVRDHRLTLAHVGKTEQVMQAMDAVPVRGPEAPRADVAMVVVLQMAWAYGESWRDTTVDETVRSIQEGHADLLEAIRSAGLSAREYVLTQMTLLLVHPVIAARRQGRASPAPADVAPENLGFAERHWAEVDRIMTGMQRRVAAARRP